MFFDRRRKLRDLAASEAQGKSFWTTKFDSQIRTKIIFALAESAPDAPSYVANVANRAAYLIQKDQGWGRLKLRDGETTLNFQQFVALADDQYLPAAIEAICLAGSQVNQAETNYFFNPFSSDTFAEEVNRVLGEHRISFELIDGEMVPFESRELHTSVVAPTLALLAGTQRFEKIEAAYRDALNELSERHPDDAVTDAARALQEALVSLGCEGNALGPLMASAKKRGLLGSHDSVLADALGKIIDWVNADRAVSGDAHLESRASQEDAWFSVHVIGALILRLTQGARKA